MKKLSILVMFLFTVTFIFSGCNSKAVKIDENIWEMVTAQSTKENGKIFAYGKGDDSASDTAIMIELECKAENGVLTLTDTTNNEVYTGEYKITDSSSESVIYDVEIENTSGKAVCSLTTYNDETSKPTLIITLGDYTLNFFNTTK